MAAATVAAMKGGGRAVIGIVGRFDVHDETRDRRLLERGGLECYYYCWKQISGCWGSSNVF